MIRIFKHKREEITGNWRNMHNEELHNLYPSKIIIRVIKSRKMRWEGNVAAIRQMRNAYILIGKYEKTALGRHRNRWEDNIKTVFRDCAD
jgi:hypothetical protein